MPISIQLKVQNKLACDLFSFFKNNTINRVTTTTLVIPSTTNLRRAALPSYAQIAKGEGDLAADSVLLCHQLRVLDEVRLTHKLGKVSKQTLEEVERCVLFTLGMQTG